MDAELAALAEAGAAALVQRMVTDGWEQARDEFTRIFSRAGTGRVGTEEGSDFAAELERSRAELVEALEHEDTTTESDVLAEWRARLRRTLRVDPASAAELRELLDALLPESGRPGQVHTISGDVYHSQVIQGQNVGGITPGGAPAEAVRSTPPGPPFGDDDDEW